MTNPSFAPLRRKILAWLKLNIVSGTTLTPTIVNVSLIRNFMSEEVPTQGTGTRVVSENDHSISVKESLEQVKAMIPGAS